VRILRCFSHLAITRRIIARLERATGDQPSVRRPAAKRNSRTACQAAASFPYAPILVGLVLEYAGGIPGAERKTHVPVIIERGSLENKTRVGLARLAQTIDSNSYSVTPFLWDLVEFSEIY